jgi:predicted nicotinamide N-methyase
VWQGISEKLASALATLLAVPVLPPSLSADRRDYVTYTLSSLGGSSSQASTVTLLENRALIAAAGTTGLRTWEASLHLGQYLCANAALVAGNRVLELGAGTGYLSILCAKLLGAANVIATDGSDDVVNALSDNFFINGFQNASHIRAVQLKWGHALVSNESVAWNENLALDIVLGADITYDESSMPLLLGTIQKLLEKHPNAEVLLAATERNAKTFAFFVAACRKVGLIVDAVDFLMPPRAKQKGPFYADNVPIHICRLVAEQAPNP